MFSVRVSFVVICHKTINLKNQTSQSSRSNPHVPLHLAENASLQSRDDAFHRNYAISIYQSRPIKTGGPLSRLDLALSTVLLELVRQQTSSRNKKNLHIFFLTFLHFCFRCCRALARILTADLHPKKHDSRRTPRAGSISFILFAFFDDSAKWLCERVR